MVFVHVCVCVGGAVSVHVCASWACMVYDTDDLCLPAIFMCTYKFTPRVQYAFEAQRGSLIAFNFN